MTPSVTFGSQAVRQAPHPRSFPAPWWAAVVGVLCFGASTRQVAAQEPSAAPAAPASVAERAAPPTYRPVQRFDFEHTRLSLPLTVGERFDLASPVRVDAAGTEWSPDPALSSHLRVGASFDSLDALDDVRLEVDYEHQVASGTHTGGVPDDPVLAPGQPLARGTSHQLRRAAVRATMGPQVRLLAGLTTSHWGMGVLANDGAQYWRPGSATFGDPNDGDVVARAGFLAGPFTSMALVVGMSADWVYADDILVGNERAHQLVALVALAPGQPSSVGAYFVVRRQDDRQGGELNVQVLDVAGNHRLALGSATLDLRGEAVVIVGETTLAGNLAGRRHRVLQGGLAASANLGFEAGGAVLDVYYASGDRNPDDRRQTGFRFDPEFRAGLLLYETVLAAQTARGAGLAGDPLLVGQPAAGLDRFPTRGSVHNTVALHPRGYWRPASGLELYGGVLLAWAAVPPVDPFNTRIAGGELRSALGGVPGRFYGTEVNLGARFQWLLRPERHAAHTELTFGLEGAMLSPGDAIVDLRGADTGLLFALHGSALYRF